VGEEERERIDLVHHVVDERTVSFRPLFGGLGLDLILVEKGGPRLQNTEKRAAKMTTRRSVSTPRARKGLPHCGSSTHSQGDTPVLVRGSARFPTAMLRRIPWAWANSGPVGFRLTLSLTWDASTVTV